MGFTANPQKIAVKLNAGTCQLQPKKTECMGRVITEGTLFLHLHVPGCDSYISCSKSG